MISKVDNHNESMISTRYDVILFNPGRPSNSPGREFNWQQMGASGSGIDRTQPKPVEKIYADIRKSSNLSEPAKDYPGYQEHRYVLHLNNQDE